MAMLYAEKMVHLLEIMETVVHAMPKTMTVQNDFDYLELIAAIK